MDITEAELAVLNNAVAGKGKLIFVMVCGSAAFNLNLPSSDRDLFGVYVADEKGPYTKPSPSMNSNDPDYCIYEIEKFVELLDKGNPKLVEPLFAKKLVWSTPEWNLLLPIKRVSLNKRTAAQYFQYAKQQYRSVLDGSGGGSPDSKRFYQSIRLLKEARSILKGGEPRVFWEGEERDQIMSIRRGEWESDAAINLIKELETEVVELITTTTIPDLLDYNKILDWHVPLKIRCLLAAQVSLSVTKDQITSGSGDVSLYELAKEALSANNVEGTILYCAPIGSDALGISSSGPRDIVAVYLPPPEALYNVFHPPTQVLVAPGGPSKAADKFKRGLQVVEVTNFFDTLMKGNHTMLESLLVHKAKRWASTAWDKFICGPDAPHDSSFFVFTSHLLHYSGTAEGLLKGKYKTDEEQKKAFRISYKLILQAKNIVANDKPSLDLPAQDLEILKGNAPTPSKDEMLSEVAQIRDAAKASMKRQNGRSYINDFVLALTKCVAD